MNRSEYKDLQALADDLALLIELKKANEWKEREQHAGKPDQPRAKKDVSRRAGVGGTDRQQARLLSGGY